MKTLKFKIIFIVCSLMIIACSNLYAGIGIDPVRIEAKAELGKELANIFKITNTGSRTLNVSVRCDDWLRRGVDPATWLTVEPAEFSVEPEKVQEVVYKINVPEESSGEFMTMVFFSGKEEGVNVGVSIGVPLYAIVKGTEKIEVEVTESNVEYNAGQGVSGWFEIKNDGNVHIRPQTRINILDNKDKKIGVSKVQFDLPVQAERKRKYAFSNKDLDLQPGKYKIIIKSSYGKLYGLDHELIEEVSLVVKSKKNTNILKRDKQKDRRHRRR